MELTKEITVYSAHEIGDIVFRQRNKFADLEGYAGPPRYDGLPSVIEFGKISSIDLNQHGEIIYTIIMTSFEKGERFRIEAYSETELLYKFNIVSSNKFFSRMQDLKYITSIHNESTDTKKNNKEE